jgi:hypothetical protein
VGQASVPLYRILQHGSTFGGLAAIGWLVGRWVLQRPVGARRFARGQAQRAIAAAVVIGAIALASLVLNSIRAREAGTEMMLGYAAVGAMDGLALGLFAFGVAHSISKRAT